MCPVCFIFRLECNHDFMWEAVRKKLNRDGDERKETENMADISNYRIIRPKYDHLFL